MRISDWSSDAFPIYRALRTECIDAGFEIGPPQISQRLRAISGSRAVQRHPAIVHRQPAQLDHHVFAPRQLADIAAPPAEILLELAGIARHAQRRSEEHTSELQSLMRISYAVFCLKKTTITLINQLTIILILRQYDYS